MNASLTLIGNGLSATNVHSARLNDWCSKHPVKAVLVEVLTGNEPNTTHKVADGEWSIDRPVPRKWCEECLHAMEAIIAPLG